MLIGTATHLECVDRSTRHNKAYTAFVIDDHTAAFKYGIRGTPGQLTVKSQPWEGTYLARRQVEAKRFSRGYLDVTSLQVDLPDPLKLTAESLHAVLMSAWEGSWAARLAPLSAPRAPADSVVVLPGWAATAKSWPGQETTQPWGQPLAAAITGAPRAVDPGSGTYAVLVDATVANWVRLHYTDPQVGHTATVLPGSEDDTAEVLAGFLRLWQPGDAGPMSKPAEALDMARAVTV